jgi:SlyX protein
MNDFKTPDLKTIGDRIDTLEARLTFQDDAIETLNKTITEQWARIDALTRQLALLGERLSEAETQPRPTNEPPPHY